MRLLILGGTVFLGRALAQAAIAAGHHVTCLARGRSGSPIEQVRFHSADRDQPTGLSVLDGESFDAVVDVARKPSQVRRAVAALAGRVGHWVYVSSISVYADQATPGQRASTAPLLDPLPPTADSEVVTAATYGAAKVACEQAVLAGLGADRAMVCRAGLIVGPTDPSYRFTYWVDRLARGGRVLAPGDPADLVQLVDVRDLAAWLLHVAEQRVAGVFDTTSAPLPRAELLAEVAAGVGATPELVWADPEFLAAHQVNPWAGERSLPLWVLADDAGMLTRDTGPAHAAGLTTRPIRHTAADTLAWLRTGETGEQCSAGLTAEQEAELLRAWDQPGPTGSR